MYEERLKKCHWCFTTIHDLHNVFQMDYDENDHEILWCSEQCYQEDQSRLKNEY